MATSWFQPPPFPVIDPEAIASAQAIANAKLEINRIIYDLPSVSNKLFICYVYAKLLFHSGAVGRPLRLHCTRIVLIQINYPMLILIKTIKKIEVT
jgi:hypothetical protein